MSRFFVDRPIVAMVIAILMVIVGAVAMLGLPVAQYPNIVPPQIQVQTTYAGADAVTVEESVATPIEQQMSGVEGMLYMQSTNANDGTLSLQVTFDIESNTDIDQVNTQNRVAQAQAILPPDVTNYGLTYRQSTGLPLLLFSLYSPNGSYNTLFIGNYATINLNDTLYRVPGVGQITNYGTADYAMRVWVKPDKLAKLGLTVSDLVTAMQAQNNVNPSGRLGADPIPKGQQFTYTVRAQLSEGLGFVDAAKVAVSESFTSNGTWPGTNALAGLDTSTNITSKYVASVAVGASGVITVKFGNDVDAAVTGMTILFTPALSTNNDISWACNTHALTGATVVVALAAGTVPAKYLPAVCR